MQNYNFCTLFDSNYLHKGLALYQSLIDLNENFHLYIVAFDDKCYDILIELSLPQLTVVSLATFETLELLRIKPSRNRAEYCWTSGPSMIYYFIKKYNLDHCTYLDADLMFFKSPKIIFDEIGNNSVAITEHIPDGPEMTTGKYCVQFVYFKNDLDGMKALEWWKDSCIDWCYARYEDGKFGDQKYLESFPSLFKNVHVIKNRGAGVAPWNAHFYDFREFGKIYFKNEETDIIFFHFHGTKVTIIDSKIQIQIIDSDIDKFQEENVYMPYLKLLKKVYGNYLKITIQKYEVIRRSNLKRFVAKIKLYFRDNKIIRYIYYNIFKNRYNGYEKNN